MNSPLPWRLAAWLTVNQPSDTLPAPPPIRPLCLVLRYAFLRIYECMSSTHRSFPWWVCSDPFPGVGGCSINKYCPTPWLSACPLLRHFMCCLNISNAETMATVRGQLPSWGHMQGHFLEAKCCLVMSSRRLGVWLVCLCVGGKGQVPCVLVGARLRASMGVCVGGSLIFLGKISELVRVQAPGHWTLNCQGVNPTHQSTLDSCWGKNRWHRYGLDQILTWAWSSRSSLVSTW